jgi:hypothetical protein
LLDATTACQQYVRETRYKIEMHEMKCQKCGAECAAGTSFCRTCGAPIDADAIQIASEQTTVHLDQAATIATQRLESRTTGRDPGHLPVTSAVPEPVVAAPETAIASRRGILVGAALIVVLGLVCAAALIVLRGQSRTATALVYPGARTVVDITGEGGGRALQLETSDSLAAVEEWYQKNLKPEKTMRLTSSSVVLKNDKTTATIAAEGGKTNILLKVAP